MVKMKWIVAILLVAAGAAMVFGQDVEAQTRTSHIQTSHTAAELPQG